MYIVLVLSIVIASFNSEAGSVINLGTKYKKAISPSEEIDLFKLTFNNYQVKFSNTSSSYGTKLYAEYKTKSISQLEDYVVVQYIKGCLFDSKLENGEIVKSSKYMTASFGELIPFKYKKWTIDTIDTDPVYASTSTDRHGRYRWNKSSNYNHKTEKYIRDEYPTKPSLYIRDIPGTAVVDDNIAKNISLKFKTCLIKEQDVPLTTDDPEIDLTAKAISCLNWDSSFIYNFEKEKFENLNKIDSYCFE